MQEDSPFLKGARSLGLEISGRSGEEVIGTCPFCGKEKHLYFNVKKAVYDCKVCGEAGGFMKLCQGLHDQSIGEFTDYERERLAKDRGLPEEAFAGYDIGVLNGEFLLPIRNANAELCDVRQFCIGQKLRSTAGCTTGLFCMARLVDPSRRMAPVYVCEGEWDAIAFEFLRKKVGEPGVVLGVPGANTFKDEWRKWFQGRCVFLCFDHDEAGRMGQARAASKLAGVASTVQVLEWPSGTLDKTDIRDLVKEVVVNEN